MGVLWDNNDFLILSSLMQVSTDYFEGDKNSIFQRLRDRAMEDPSCGQTALIKKKGILVPKSEIMVHAIVTNIIHFKQSSSEALKDHHPLNSMLKRRTGEDAKEMNISRKRSRSRRSRKHSPPKQ